MIAPREKEQVTVKSLKSVCVWVCMLVSMIKVGVQTRCVCGQRTTQSQREERKKKVGEEMKKKKRRVTPMTKIFIQHIIGMHAMVNIQMSVSKTRHSINKNINKQKVKKAYLVHF